MIKFTAYNVTNGRTLLGIGLSFGNLRKFLREPGETMIKIEGKEIDLPIDVMIFSGETEAHMATLMDQYVNEKTVVHIDPKLKT